MRTCQGFGCPREPKGTSILCAEHGKINRTRLAADQERADIISKYGMYTVSTVRQYREATL